MRAQPDPRPDLFGPQAAAYDAWYGSAAGALVLDTEFRALRAALHPERGGRILDFGTGTGVFARLLREVGACVIGLDVSIGMLAEARRHDAALPLVRGRGDRLPFPDDSFDGVFAITVLEFIPDRAAAFAEICRVTRPGGTAVIGVLNARSPWAWLRRRSGSNPVYAAAHHYTAAELRRLLRPCGPARVCYLVHFPARPLRIARPLQRADAALARLPGAALLLATVNVTKM